MGGSLSRLAVRQAQAQGRLGGRQPQRHQMILRRIDDHPARAIGTKHMDPAPRRHVTAEVRCCLPSSTVIIAGRGRLEPLATNTE